MKKFIALLMVLTMVLAFASCGSGSGSSSSTGGTGSSAGSTSSSASAGSTSSSAGSSGSAAGSTATPAPGTNDDTDKKSDGVMTYAEFIAADIDAEVVIEAYVQGKQSWWDNKATVYTQDKDGAYFLYEMACSEDDYEKLTKGTKIKVTGFKAEWSGEIEITDATFEIGEGSYIAPAKDVTSLLGTDTLINHMNEFVSFKGLTVEAAKEGEDVAYLYKWNGAGEDGDDLYFNVSLDGKTYTFTVESYLCDKSTDVYAAVKGLTIGDKIDMEGFLYWYEGANPHITSVTPAK